MDKLHQLNKILLIQTASIGDVILATALAEKLHAYYPSAAIDFLLKKDNESLFESHPFLNEVLIWDKKGSKYINLLKLIRKFRKRKYDLIVNVQRFASSGFITVFSNPVISIGFDKNPFSRYFTRTVKHSIGEENSLHETERNQLLISEFTDKKPARPVLYPAQKDYHEVQSLVDAGTSICIAPASLWYTKQYPAEKWIALINKLPGDYLVYLLGAKSDLNLCEHILKQSDHSNVKILAGKLGLLSSAALMEKAAMTFTNDSAPMHLASSVNAPVSVVFCSTVPSFGFGPLSDKSFVIETAESLECRPCGLHGYKTCPEKHFKCALTISYNQLLDNL